MTADEPDAGGQTGLTAPWTERRLPAALMPLWALLPGSLLVVVITVAAQEFASWIDLPVMFVALVIGIGLAGAGTSTSMAPGANFVARHVLRLGVALLGARISLSEILALGWEPFLVVVIAMASTIGFGVVGARMLGFSRDFGVLSGGATAICGASAALAIGAALPQSANSGRDIVFTVVGVTTLSTLAMVTYPLFCRLAGFDAPTAGIFIGATIHDVAQVIGAGYALSEEAGDVATVTKLLRVCLLAPIVVVISLWFSSGSRPSATTVPFFLLGFVALATATSLGILPAAMLEAVEKVSGFCLIAAVAALGLATSVRALAQVGRRAMFLMAAETAFIALLALSLLLFART